MAGPNPMTASEFSVALDVSRETLERLVEFEAMLRQWQKTINLVSTNTLNDVWRRHFLDSGQLCQLMSGVRHIVDIGSGGGFPGLVVAIMSGSHVTMVESDGRKAAFLREASRATAADTSVLVGRAEVLEAIPADAITVRAVAPLVRLLPLVERWLKPGGNCYLLKGASVEDELTDASRFWDINYDLVPSLSDPTGSVLRVKEFQRV